MLAYLDDVDRLWRGALTRAADAAGPEPADRLLGMFDALASACRSDGFHGCAFINTAAEAVPGTAVHARTVAHKDAVRAWVGVMAADPEAAVAAAGAARALVAAAVPAS